MRSKLVVASLLISALAVTSSIIFFVFDPWTRLLLCLTLLIPIVWASSYLGVAEMLSDLPTTINRARRFTAFRTNVTTLLDECRRLHWLVVDLDRGFRDSDSVKEDIRMSKLRMQELLSEVQQSAGQSNAESGEEEHLAHPTG